MPLATVTILKLHLLKGKKTLAVGWLRYIKMKDGIAELIGRGQWKCSPTPGNRSLFHYWLQTAHGFVLWFFQPGCQVSALGWKSSWTRLEGDVVRALFLQLPSFWGLCENVSASPALGHSPPKDVTITSFAALQGSWACSPCQPAILEVSLRSGRALVALPPCLRTENKQHPAGSAFPAWQAQTEGEPSPPDPTSCESKERARLSADMGPVHAKVTGTALIPFFHPAQSCSQMPRPQRPPLTAVGQGHHRTFLLPLAQPREWSLTMCCQGGEFYPCRLSAG